jgi:hypothetical protein
MSSHSSHLIVPAEYAEDFRAAVVEEIANTARHAQEERAELEQRTYERDPRADLTAGDLAGVMLLLARDARVLVDVGHHGSGDIQVDIDADGTLAHVFESMARDVIGPRLADALRVCPIEADYAAELTGLIGRLSWAIDQAAGCHDVFARINAERRQVAAVA